MDPISADLFAEYVSSLGFDCGLVQLSGLLERWPHGVLVARETIAELKEKLRLKPVLESLTAEAAQLTAGRLARDDIPSFVAGLHSFYGSNIRADELATLATTSTEGCAVCVPQAFFSRAMRVLNEPPITEAELTELALRSSPDKD